VQVVKGEEEPTFAWRQKAMSARSAGCAGRLKSTGTAAAARGIEATIPKSRRRMVTWNAPARKGGVLVN
jgi:hypothetical protein